MITHTITITLVLLWATGQLHWPWWVVWLPSGVPVLGTLICRLLLYLFSFINWLDYEAFKHD